MPRNTARNQGRLGFMVPFLILVLTFVIASGIVATVFIKSVATLGETKDLNCAVQIARNEAEIVRSGTVKLEHDTRVYFDENYNQVSAEKAKYYAIITEKADDMPKGSLLSDTISVYNLREEKLYELVVSRYSESEGE